MRIALVVLGCALALAACGSTISPTATNGGNSSNYGSFLNFSTCMRSHGVTDFPDPKPGGGIDINPGSGLNPKSPVFQAAKTSCKHLLPGGGPPAQVPESVKLQALEHARCMRRHGVPNYPDPTFPKGGGIFSRPPPGVSPDSPAFQTAVKACGGP